MAILGVLAADARPELPPLPEGLGPAPEASEGPPLPEGLAETPREGEAPALPEGLGGAPEDAEGPPLPEGLGEPEPRETTPEGPPEAQSLELPFDLAGFWELRGGVRTRDDRYQKDAALGETRLQIQLDKAFKDLSLRLTTDLIYDMVLNEPRVDIEEGRGIVDLREAWAVFRPAPRVDVKIGRQILTWGTGDLLFLNDLFPKDFVAFFIGRDTEYLKAPSDAVKVSLFSDLANLDLVYTPRFDADRFPTGRRVSFYNAQLGRRSGRDAVLDPLRPDRCFNDDELALRAYRMLGAFEVALYGYYGFWKDPLAFDRATGRPTYTKLAAYGASVRAPVGPGIAHAEVAYYDSIDDRPGNDPFVPNSQLRLLAGYEQELARNLTAGVQYYVELRMDQDAFSEALPPGFPGRNRDRHLLTLRVTKQAMNQNLELSLFGFYSPTDGDAHLRPRVAYKVDDHWSVFGGANVFFGRHDHTFFGQLERNSNLFAGLRYSF